MALAAEHVAERLLVNSSRIL